ncbi:hypothetical protein CLIM01_14390 [Colletotrichum limetticola]|uniref:Uncharacterized protein n=1 Tax=Colletotrichum limetticola TaxID=1209924 RepID=A0ABQ9P8N7_9PEZI|nr:hypothetical protein CLIM01_14390 [Colletotrichum limetticola]
MAAGLLPEVRVRNARLDSTSTTSRRRSKLPGRRPTPTRGRIMSSDRCTRGERMSCGILPRDLTGDLQGRNILTVSNEALCIFS